MRRRGRGETVPAGQLRFGQQARLYTRVWVAVGIQPGDLGVRLVGWSDHAVVYVDPAEQVELVGDAEPVLYGQPLDWARQPFEAPPGGQATQADRWATLLVVLDGAALTAYDRQALQKIAVLLDTSLVATLANQIVRARGAGPLQPPVRCTGCDRILPAQEARAGYTECEHCQLARESAAAGKEDTDR